MNVPKELLLPLKYIFDMKMKIQAFPFFPAIRANFLSLQHYKFSIFKATKKYGKTLSSSSFFPPTNILTLFETINILLHSCAVRVFISN